MNFYVLSAVINIVSSAVLGVLVWTRRSKNPLSVSFTYFACAIFIWSVPYFLWQISSAEYGLFLTRLLMVGAIFIPITYLHFVYSFVGSFNAHSRFIRCSYAIFTVFAIFDATPYFISHTESIFGFVSWPIAGPVFSIFLFLWVWYAILSIAILWKHHRHSTGITRYQTVYILIGTIIGAIGGITNYFLWYRIPIPPFGNVTASIYLLFITYAILRYRLMDIRVMAQKTFIYITEVVFVYVLFFLLVWCFRLTVGDSLTGTGFAVGIVLAPLFVYLFYQLDRGLKSFSHRYLFVSLYNYQETMTRLAKRLSDYIELDKIVDLIVDTIKDSMQLDRVGILILDSSVTPVRYHIARVDGFNEQNGISLVEDSLMTQHLFETRTPLESDELLALSRAATTPEHRDGFLRLYEQMKRIEASLCLPLISKDALIGMIVMGSKISQDAYTVDDLEMLSSIAQQASIAIENALQYRQIEHFSATLQQRVDEQTERLRHINQTLEEKNDLNQELLEMKNDFLRVVNHQLNTPISIMRGYFRMMKDGRYTPEKALPIIESGLDRISQTISDFWDAYELEGERMKMNLAPVDITSVVDAMVIEKQNLTFAKNRNLTVSVIPPSAAIPTVWCDIKKITHVISNLLDNAIYYTYNGSITVAYTVEGPFLRISVTDTGTGITSEDKEQIFKKFTRGTGASGMHPDGSGLGLYIAKKIVEGNGGEITVASEGPGKGATFSFTVPLFADQQATALPQVERQRQKVELFI